MNPNILIERLLSLGIIDGVVFLIDNFLTDRQFCVKLQQSIIFQVTRSRHMSVGLRFQKSHISQRRVVMRRSLRQQRMQYLRRRSRTNQSNHQKSRQGSRGQQIFFSQVKTETYIKIYIIARRERHFILNSLIQIILFMSFLNVV